MFFRKYWLPLSVFIVGMSAVGIYVLQTQTPKEPIKIYKPVEVEKPKETEAPVGDTSEGGHWHGDEWHADPHETHDPPAVSASKSYIPEGAAVTPDFPPVDPTQDPVEAAYKRLEYIKNNPYAWGGVHSERATELIVQLMPPPVLVDHDDGDEVIEQITELIAQNDPRAAEVLITHMCEGDTAGRPMIDALGVIGPPAVAYILPYLEKGVAEGGTMSIAIFDALVDIGERYRGDLGGIVDYLIIPKLEVIAADEKYERYGSGTVMDAQYALEQLGR